MAEMSPFGRAFTSGLETAIEGDRRQRRFAADQQQQAVEARAARRDKLRGENLKIIGEVGSALAEIRTNQGPEAAQQHLQMLAPVIANLSFGSGIPPDQLGQRLRLAAETGATGAELGAQEGAKAAAAAPGQELSTRLQTPADAARAAAIESATKAAQQPFDIAKERRAFADQLTLEDFKANLKGGEGDKENFKQAKDLRGEFSKASGEFETVRNSYGRVQVSAQNPSAAGDLSLIFNYMKMLDPGSTVREGEFATAQNTTGVPGQILTLYNRVTSGERMNETQRADFVSRAGDLFAQQKRFQDQNVERFTNFAKRFDIDPDLVVSDLSQGLQGKKNIDALLDQLEAAAKK